MLRSRHVLILAKLGFLGLLLLALPGFALAVLYTEPFAGWRHAQAEALLSDAIGLDSSINGPVEIGFGWNPLITLTDIAGDRGDLATDVKEVSADRLALRISIPTLLTGKVDLNAIVVDGLKVDIDIPTDADAEKAGRKEDDDLAIGEFIQDFVRSQFSSDVTVNGLDLTFDNQETGFAMHYALDRIAATPSDAGAIAIAGAGSINNAPWTIEGEVAAPGDDDEFRNFTLTASQAGLTSKLSGRYAFDDEADRIDAALTGTSPALARLLEVYDIRGDLDGTGEISAKFSGALAKLALSDLGLKLNFKNGNSIELTGSAADVVAGTGLDLILTGKLVPQAASGEKPLYDLGVTGFTGRIAGAVDGVLVRDFHVTTTSLKAQLKEFGPISAERVWKDPEGRLGLYDVLVLAGDPKAPSVRVTGTVKNIIQFQGVDLKGAIDFRTADFLDLAAEENAEKLGHLKGNIALSDADGSLGIEALTAEVVNSVLLALRINLVFDDLNKADDLVFDTNLDIQNFKAFAATLGSDIEDLGAVAFNGKVTGSNERISASGTTNVGETVITGTLTGAFTGGRPVLSGDIATPILHLSDLTKLVSIRSVYLANVDNTDTDIIEYSQGWEKLFVDLQIKVAKISGGGPGTSNIQGRVTYGEGIVGLDPLTMSFLGGRASATGKIDTTGTENAFRGEGPRRQHADRRDPARDEGRLSGERRVAGELRSHRGRQHHGANPEKSRRQPDGQSPQRLDRHGTARPRRPEPAGVAPHQRQRQIRERGLSRGALQFRERPGRDARPRHGDLGSAGGGGRLCGLPQGLSRSPLQAEGAQGAVPQDRAALRHPGTDEQAAAAADRRAGRGRRDGRAELSV